MGVGSVKEDLSQVAESRRELLATETKKKLAKETLLLLFRSSCGGLSRRLSNLIVIGCSFRSHPGSLMETAASDLQSKTH